MQGAQYLSVVLLPVCHFCEDVDDAVMTLVRSDRGWDPCAVLGVERLVDDGPVGEQRVSAKFNNFSLFQEHTTGCSAVCVTSLNGYILRISDGIKKPS